jgi:hypothetical protein
MPKKPLPQFVAPMQASSVKKPFVVPIKLANPSVALVLILLAYLHC